MAERPVRILHAHSTFSLGGKEARAVRLMNAFGDAAEHVVLSATDQLGAREAIDAAITVDFPTDAPSLVGKPAPGRYRKLSRYMRQFDLVLTYNWGSMDAVGARRLFGGPPLIHAEDGFNEDEAERLNPKRNLFRRLMLPAAHKVVVPSQTLARIARTAWRQPERRVERIANGIALDCFRAPPSRSIPGLDNKPGRLVVGTIAGLRAVKDLPHLVRAFAAASRGNDLLVIVGDGPEAEAIRAQAAASNIADRVVMPGFMADPAGWIGHFDVFALSSKSEQFPISLVEAMAAGLPAACTGVGDVADMVAEENRPLIGDAAVFQTGLETLLNNSQLRASLGAANRSKAFAEYDERVMISRYAALYGEAIGRPDALGRRLSEV